MDIQKLKDEFFGIYGRSNEDVRIYFAPGRVNLIGEHTDYNGGYVLPCALSYGTYLLVRKASLPVLDFRSRGFDFQVRVPLSAHYSRIQNHWVNYPLGILQVFALKGQKPSGMEFYFAGNIPNGAGLSSSASIEMVTAFALNDMMGWDYSVLDLINFSKKAENEFVGVNCGIMDMFAVGLAEKEHALFLNCKTLSYSLTPLDLKAYRLVIMNTGKKRGLSGSKYNERVAECKQAVEFLQPALQIESLGQLSIGNFEQYGHLIRDKTVYKRARHVVGENWRVLESVKALKKSDLPLFGNMLNLSHDSLRDDYEVSGFELDSMVEIARTQSGVLAARMTGAGFGGCAIAFVKENQIENFISETERTYTQKTGLMPEFYLPDTGEGVRKLEQ